MKFITPLSDQRIYLYKGASLNILLRSLSNSVVRTFVSVKDYVLKRSSTHFNYEGSMEEYYGDHLIRK